LPGRALSIFTPSGKLGASENVIKQKLRVIPVNEGEREPI
jgi:hypothetical protein